MHKVLNNKLEMLNLRDRMTLVAEYVKLRNSYQGLLLTNTVDVNSTKKWLLSEDVEVLCLLDDNVLVGVTILFLNREGEIAIFVKRKNKGFGTLLLQEIELVAKSQGIKKLWSWVLISNVPAQKLFIKSGYLHELDSRKYYRNKFYNGYIFKKKIIG